MITPADEAYKSTKRLLQGSDALAYPFDQLAAWISKTWDVRVLNVVYKYLDNVQAPRLQVILEQNADVEPLCYDKQKQDAVATRFLELLADWSGCPFRVDGLFVVFSAFAPIALAEADGRLTDEDIDNFLGQLGNPELWTIQRFFGNAIFFFYTEEQVARSTAKGLQEDYARRYFDLLEPYDEFDCLKECDYRITFDSKQNLDKKYRGRWADYFR